LEETAMDAGVDLQVWLDSQAGHEQLVIIPYVKTTRDRQLSYRMEVVQRGAGGSSRISQQGRVLAEAAEPASLAHITLGARSTEECEIRIMLDEAGKAVGIYRFDCPR
jgi:hypothetical protein